MLTDTEILAKGLQLLTQYLGESETERFVVLMQKAPFDYTAWRQQQVETRTLSEIDAAALAARLKH